MNRFAEPDAFEALRAHFARYVDLSDEEFARIEEYFTHRKVRKSHFLLQQGEVCRNLAFVVNGALRLYSLDDGGKEHIIQFGFSGWWISDLYSFLIDEPSINYIDALDASELLLIDRAGYESLCEDNPKFDRYFRLLLQNHHIATHRRIRASLSMSAEKKYLHLLEVYPGIEQCVAQRHLASYLGITPESLSRIRKQLAQGNKEDPDTDLDPHVA